MATLKQNSTTCIDFKNGAFLRKYTTIQGKILSRRITGLTAKEHRHLTKAIKQARILGFLPFMNSV